MSRWWQLPVSRFGKPLVNLRRDERAAQIVEFALSLPLLVVFVVGIFDFSSAVTLKQKLTNAAREGARIAAADPASDLSGSASGVPVSVWDAFYVVDNYLVGEKINDCGLSAPATPVQSAGSLTWVSTASGCAGFAANPVTLTINRGLMTRQSISGTTTDVINTQVLIQYPYKWTFGGVIGLLVPGTSYANVSYITGTGTAFNEN